MKIESGKDKNSVNGFPRCNGNPPFYGLEPIDSDIDIPAQPTSKKWSLLTRVKREANINLVELWKLEKKRIEEKNKV
jgi:hypothetical protein